MKYKQSQPPQGKRGKKNPYEKLKKRKNKIHFSCAWMNDINRGLLCFSLYPETQLLHNSFLVNELKGLD